MKRKIVITPLAKSEIQEIFHYLILKWNDNVKKEFANKLKNTVNCIAENPEMYPISEKNRRIRRCVISKQNSIFYYFDSDNVVVVSVFDNRQNPNNIKK